MPFDTQTRNRLARLVTVARELITAEFAQQLQSVYGIAASGEVTPLSELGHLDEEQRALAELLRDRVGYLKASSGGERDPGVAAVDRLTREQAFTVLNRLAALRMAENRGFILESVGRGYQSKGFQVYSQVAGSGLGDTFHRYRRYLFCLFDEIAVDLQALFERRSPTGLLFPREPALLALFQLINAPEINTLWTEDETIGWIYQYYNDEAERKRMRELSAAPRNGRELAVRNQFFTPRYVVEFLVDNTVGRIWYEARKGETDLKKICRYLVRHPNEFFLAADEPRPAATVAGENLSNEDLLNQRVHIPHRSRKDPRDLKILDPACGSGHFLLYSFDLLETIYEEAWLDDRQVPSEISGRSIREDYKDLQTLREAVPELIIRHNLHGIDIDLRACQIAALALWLRAQRTYERHNLKPKERPKITKSNIVCAEPMPGDRALLGDFVADLQPKVLGQLVQVVFEKMKLAGEAGALLKIDQEIAGTVAEAKRLWLASPKTEQTRLFAEDVPEQIQLSFDLSGITDDAFWEKAEGRIYTELQAYANEAETGNEYQRRSFAEDAARGFAFIETCRKRFDVVLMNPPFGKCSDNDRSHFESTYPAFKADIGMAFVDRFGQMLADHGCVGALTSRTFLASDSFEDWRKECVLDEKPIAVFLDLGYGVLDGAMVEAAAWVSDARARDDSPRLFIRALESRDKEAALQDVFHQGKQRRDVMFFAHRLTDFMDVPLAVICYWLPASLLHRVQQVQPLERSGAAARHGLVTTDDFRFFRLTWEVAPSNLLNSSDGPWKLVAKGGEYQPYWDDLHLCIDWSRDGSEIKAYLAQKRLETQGSADWTPWLNHSEYYGIEGLTYPERTTSDFCPRVLPRGVIFTSKGQAIQFIDANCNVLAYLCGSFTRFYRLIVESFVGSGDNAFPGSAAKDYRSGLLNQLPPPLLNSNEELERIFGEAILFAKRLFVGDETARNFSPDIRASSLASMQQKHEHELLESAARQVVNNRVVEDFVARHFALTTAEASVVDEIIGPHPESYPDAQPGRLEGAPELWTKSVTDVVKVCIEKHGPRRQLTKKSFIADRKLELLCHLFQASPRSVVAAIKASGRLSADSLVDAASREISFCLGCAFGRWDVNFAIGKTRKGGQQDPFAPLPPCPPGMLQNEVGLPLTQADAAGLRAAGAWDYPLEVPWTGILIDDPENVNDIVNHVRTVLNAIWANQAEAIEHEACEYLRVRDLREYFRKPSLFFADHLKRYSQSRRQAPIYWPLSTPSGRYTLWLYYPRLTAQTLHQCMADFLIPKLKNVSAEIQMLRGSNGSQSRLGELVELQDELKDMQVEIERIIKLPYVPNLDDGVLVTASPLWRLFRLPKWQKDLKRCWEEVQAGDYDWAHLAYSIFTDRVKQRCKGDRSLAIAHNLENLCELDQTKQKATKGRPKQAFLVSEDAT